MNAVQNAGIADALGRLGGPKEVVFDKKGKPVGIQPVAEPHQTLQ